MRNAKNGAVRPGYVLVGWTKYFRHHKTRRVIYARPGSAFPIWRRAS